MTSRSDRLREDAEAVLRCIELGFLTLRRGRDVWTNTIRITRTGLAYLDPLNYQPQDESAQQ